MVKCIFLHSISSFKCFSLTNVRWQFAERLFGGEKKTQTHLFDWLPGPSPEYMHSYINLSCRIGISSLLSLTSSKSGWHLMHRIAWPKFSTSMIFGRISSHLPFIWYSYLSWLYVRSTSDRFSASNDEWDIKYMNRFWPWFNMKMRGKNFAICYQGNRIMFWILNFIWFYSIVYLAHYAWMVTIQNAHTKYAHTRTFSSLLFYIVYWILAWTMETKIKSPG